MEKEIRYTVQETTEKVQLGTDAATVERVLVLHKISRTPGGKKVDVRVVATFWSEEALGRYLKDKAIDKSAVTFPKEAPSPAAAAR